MVVRESIRVVHGLSLLVCSLVKCSGVENTTLVGNRVNKGGALHTYQGDTFIVSANFNQNTAHK